MVEEQVVVFRIREEEYAIPVAERREIAQYQPLAKLAGLPDYVAGVVKVRGKPVPVIDLSVKFGLMADEQPDRSLIIVAMDPGEIGIIVDEVMGTLTLPTACVEPTPGGNSGQGCCIRGIGKAGDRLIFLFDLKYLFTDNELAALQEVG